MLQGKRMTATARQTRPPMRRLHKSTAMNMRVPPSLRKACEAEADRRGLDLSAWLRMVLTDATRDAPGTPAPPQQDGRTAA